MSAQIQEEKEKLVKEGKIKKQMPLPPFNLEAVPFEVPENWMFVKIGQMFHIQAGKSIIAKEIRDVQDDEYLYPYHDGNGLRIMHVAIM